MDPNGPHAHMDLRERMAAVFTLWSIPIDLERQSMDWVRSGMYGYHLLWLWILIKVPSCRAAFALHVSKASDQTIEGVARGAVAAALSKWRSLSHAHRSLI